MSKRARDHLLPLMYALVVCLGQHYGVPLATAALDYTREGEGPAMQDPDEALPAFLRCPIVES